MSRSPQAAKRDKRSKSFFVQKPSGRLNQRVQTVGPEHFAIVSIDCAKARSCYILADFYGHVYIEPTTLPHTRGDFQAAIDRIRQTLEQHDLRDVVIAIERTGEYHRPVQRAFRQTGWETRLVHSYATKQFRQPADPGNKTDPTDLAAIHRVTVNGFGLIEPIWPDDYQHLQLLRRHRHDLVRKSSRLQCQIREHLHAAMPGYAECFCHLWESDSPSALFIGRQTGSAEAVRQAGCEGLTKLLKEGGIRPRQQTLQKVLKWAENAPPGHPHNELVQQIVVALDDDRREKTRQIRDVERRLAHLVVGTPYVLLLAIPGINIVSIADLAGELGPIDLYANANCITGRAALMPSRYQSDQVDRCHGPLRRCGNRRLRAVLMQIASNLAQCNHHFKALASSWGQQGKDPRWIRVKIVKRFSRIAFAMVAGRQLFPHPCCQSRHYILDKILKFHRECDTPVSLMHQDLEAAIAQLPQSSCRDEAKPLRERLDELAQRRRGPQPLADILPLVLARLEARQLQSKGGADPS